MLLAARLNRFFLLALLLPALLAGCGGMTDTGPAEAAVTQFHAALDAGRHAELYEAASTEFKAVAKREEFLAMLAAVHRKLGNVKSASRKGWNVNGSLTGGSTVVLAYETEFADSRANETFTFRQADGRAQLIGYNIASLQLIIR